MNGLAIKKKRIVIFCFPFLAALTSFFSTVTIYAHTDADKKAIDILTQFDGYFERWNLINYALRNLGWMITNGLWWFCDQMENMLDKAYYLINFTTSSGVNSFMDKVEPILYGVFCLALVVFAVQKIINPEFGGAIFSNIILSALVLCATTTMMNTANSIIQDSRAFIKQMNGSSVSTADITVAEGITDLYIFESYEFKNILKKDGELKRPSISDPKWDHKKYSLIYNIKNLDYVEADERIDGDNAENPYTGEDVSEAIFDNYIYYEGKANEIDDGPIDFLRPQYYRYSIDFLTIWITLIALIVVFLLSSYKVVRIIYELAIHRIAVPFFAVGDISNGKKVRQVLSGMLGSYITLIVITVLQQMFLVAKTYISDKISNPLYSSFFIAFLAIAVIDAPNIFEQVFGIDAGLKSGLSMFAVARTIAASARTAGHVLSATGSAAVGGAAFGAGAISGAGAKSNLDTSIHNSSNTETGTGSSGLSGSGQAVTKESNHEKESNNLQNEEKNSNQQTNLQNQDNFSTNNMGDIPVNKESEIYGDKTTKENEKIPFQNPKDTGAPNTPIGENGSIQGKNGKQYDDMYHQGSKNLTGRQYQGGIGSFLKQNTKVGQNFSKGQDFGNAVRNSLANNDNSYREIPSSDSNSIPATFHRTSSGSGTTHTGQVYGERFENQSATNQAIFRELQNNDDKKQ